jgi:plasmid stabilization system protein ParE
MMVIEFTQLADRTIFETSIHWRRHHPSQPDLFDDELSRALELLKTAPEMGPRVFSRRFRGARKVLLKDSGHILVYRLVSKQRLRVLALVVGRAAPEVT